MQDRQIKTLLIIVAGLLAINVGVSLWNSAPGSVDVLVSPAQAQSNQSRNQPQIINVLPVKGFTVQDLKDVVSLGDGKTFVARNEKGFMVYQVTSNR